MYVQYIHVLCHEQVIFYNYVYANVLQLLVVHVNHLHVSKFAMKMLTVMSVPVYMATCYKAME